MKSDLDHLPEEKQAALHRIIEILREEFAWLEDHVVKLQGLVEGACTSHIEKLQKAI